MNTPYAGSPEHHARLKPDDCAFIEGDVRLSWAQWDASATALANALRSLGVASGHRIAVRTGIRHEWFVIYLAASKLGAAIVGINSRATPAELEYFLADSGARAFICDDETPAPVLEIARRAGLDPVVSFARTEAPCYFDLIRAAAPEPIVSQGPAQLILYTSGTTGRPKGVTIERNLLAARPDAAAYLAYMANLIPVDASSRFLLTLPLHHGAGPNSALFCLRAGGSVVILPRFDPQQALAAIHTHRATSLMAVPTLLHRIAALPEATRAGYDMSSMRTLNIGAAAVPGWLKRWAADFFGPQCLIFEGYGMSELQMISYMLPGEWKTKPESSGRPMPYVQVKIVDDQGRTLGLGAVGEICARTPMMIEGYLNRPPLGAADLTADGFFRTGDVGYLDEDGYLFVTDRLKDMVIVGGANVYPAEVEAVLNQHGDIVEAAVIGIPDDDMGEQVVALCEVRDPAAFDAAAVIQFCRERLSAYKAPRVVKVVAELPRNATGKVMKRVLREPFWQGRQRSV